MIAHLFSRYAILNEVWRLVDDGIVDVKDIDKVISEGLGMRYAFLGSLETAHLNAEGMKSYIERYVTASTLRVCMSIPTQGDTDHGIHISIIIDSGQS